MKIKVNNIEHKIPEESLSISELLVKMSFTYPIIVVKFMSKIIDESEFEHIYLKDGDEISVMHVFAGG